MTELICEQQSFDFENDSANESNTDSSMPDLISDSESMSDLTSDSDSESSLPDLISDSDYETENEKDYLNSQVIDIIQKTNNMIV